jgi:hypothetical protein
MAQVRSEDWRATPPDILSAIRTTEKGVERLQWLANAEELHRKFTLDGRLVGDIGELVVFRSFKDIQTTKTTGHVHDLIALINRKEVGVQVKLRRAGKTAKLEFKSRPEVLLALQFDEDWSRWRVVFNGSGAVLKEKGVTLDGERRFRRGRINTVIALSLNELAAAHLGGKYSSPCLKQKKK